MKSDASAQQVLSFLERSTSPVLSSQPIDEALEDALTALDEGQISLHISFSAITQFEQLNCAHRAQDMFSRAITELDKVNERTHNSEEWQFWRSEAEHGLAIAVTQVTRTQSTRGSIL
jgi:glycyl-tRNA synthetase beta subunit